MRAIWCATIAQGDSTPVLAAIASGSAPFVLDDAGQRAVLGLRAADFDAQRHIWAITLAGVCWLRGDSMRMRAYADSARDAATEALHASPDGPQILMTLAFADALEGRREAALHAGERAAALLPISRDAHYGAGLVLSLAQLNVLLGRDDQAITQLETVLAIPSGISVPWLRVDPSWAPLRGNPRFERLIAQPTPGTPPTR